MSQCEDTVAVFGDLATKGEGPVAGVGDARRESKIGFGESTLAILDLVAIHFWLTGETTGV